MGLSFTPAADNTAFQTALDLGSADPQNEADVTYVAKTHSARLRGMGGDDPGDGEVAVAPVTARRRTPASRAGSSPNTTSTAEETT